MSVSAEVKLNQAPPGKGVPVIEAIGIHKSFGPKHVLKGVDLAVDKAEVVTILGPNGCGKSTFLRCLNLLEQYQAGKVLLKGSMVSEGKPESYHPDSAEQAQAQMLRRHVGMVFQRFNLFPHMTVFENVMSGPKYVMKFPEIECKKIAEQTLKKVGLWEKHPCDPLTLSGGQQQRVAIARALAMNPDVMLFDEATSALDPVLTKEVFKVVRDLAAEGMTMILVTHDMDFARDIADRVVFMDGGVIAAQGVPNTFLMKDRRRESSAFWSAGDQLSKRGVNVQALTSRPVPRKVFCAFEPRSNAACAERLVLNQLFNIHCD
jgi:ABC-type polar amino acid transport system ATPase subunit